MCNKNIHSFSSLSYDRSKSLPKRALNIVRSRASSFKREYPLLSLRPSSSFLRLLPCLPVTSTPPCIFPSVTRCRRQFLRKIWPTQLAFHLLISCKIFICAVTLSSTSSFLTWSLELIFSRTTFQNFPVVSDLVPDVFKFKHHIKLCSKCSTSLVSSSIIRKKYTGNNSKLRVLVVLYLRVTCICVA
jgi:hypothetical protein